MDAVYRRSLEQLNGIRILVKLRLKLTEFLWRIGSGRLIFFMILSGIFWVLTYMVWHQLSGDRLPDTYLYKIYESLSIKKISLQAITDIAKAISAVTALAVTVIGLLHGFTRSLLGGSAEAARSFVKFSQDPINRLSAHFRKMVKRIRWPIAIFIDDLDRCNSKYAVELLEGIQTIFREANVIYTVAADKRWLVTSFENVYEEFQGKIEEIGRPLGHLFLEKTIQMSVPVPRLSAETKGRYWKKLIGEDGDREVFATVELEGSDTGRSYEPPSENATLQEESAKSRKTKSTSTATHKEPEPEPIEKIARRRLGQLDTVEKILQEVNQSSGSDEYDQEIRKAAVVRLAAPSLQAQTEHALRHYSEFLEPNPRFMKRLVNAYGIHQALDIVFSEKKSDQHKLILWRQHWGSTEK